MHKYFNFFCIATLMCTLFTGCQTQAGQPQETEKNGTYPTEYHSESPTNPSSQKSETDKTEQNSKDTTPPSTQTAYQTGGVYITEKQIVPMSQSVTVDGITYQVLNYEITSSFGNRKLENLANLNYYMEMGKMDEQGNMTGDERYIFLTIQFTNTTDTEVEILRDSKGLFFFDEHLFIDDGTIDAIYMDEHWLEGTANEIYHYKLAPQETITSEVGWMVFENSLNSHDNIYYTMKMTDCMTEGIASTDPNAIFIELELE